MIHICYTASCIITILITAIIITRFICDVLPTCLPTCLYLVRELLSFYEFPGDDIPVIKGSALAAATDGDKTIGRDAILALIEAVEAAIPTPIRETEKPFLMPVEDIL